MSTQDQAIFFKYIVNRVLVDMHQLQQDVEPNSTTHSQHTKVREFSTPLFLLSPIVTINKTRSAGLLRDRRPRRPRRTYNPRRRFRPNGYWPRGSFRRNRHSGLRGAGYHRISGNGGEYGGYAVSLQGWNSIDALADGHEISAAVCSLSEMDILVVLVEDDLRGVSS